MIVAVLGSSATSVSASTPGPDDTAPLVISRIGDAPIPVKGSDDKFHVAYELSVLNDHPDAAVFTSLETVAPDGRVVSTWSGEQLRPLTIVVPDLTNSGAPATGIPPGGTALLVLDDVYADPASIPRTVTHRLSATFRPPAEASAARVALFPSSITETGRRMPISTKQPVVLGAPVAGPGWVMGFGCCDELNGHRGAMLPVADGINGTERFGIDFGVLSPSVTPGTPLTDAALLQPGTDGTRNEDFLSYGSPLLAVADATVVKATDGIPDTAPGAKPGGEEGLAVSDVGGNEVILRLAPHLFAFYLHNEPGSLKVKEGDKVVKGQQIAALGSSGNSLAPHLHFQLGTTPHLISAANLPYVFERFVVKGSLKDGTEFVAAPTPGPRKLELPLANNVVDFPAAK